MNCARWNVAILALVVVCCQLPAQETEPRGEPQGTTTASDEVDDRLGVEELDEDAYEEHDDDLRNPLDINTAVPEDLRRIHGIPEPIIDRLLTWRNAGRIRTFEELRRIPGMSVATLNVLRRYTRIEGPAPPSAILDVRSRNTLAKADLDAARSDVVHGERSDNRILLRAEERTLFPGERIDVSAGVRLRKDPGFVEYDDVRSGYARIALRQESIALTIGTVRIKHAQGIILRSGEMLSERAEDRVHSMRFGTRISPFTGSMTASALVGFVVEKRWRRWTAVLFSSDRDIELPSGAGTDPCLGVVGRERTVGGTVEWNVSDVARVTCALLRSGLRTSPGTADERNLSLGGLWEFSDGTISGEAGRDGSGHHAWSAVMSYMPLPDVVIGAAMDRRESGFRAPLSDASSSWSRRMLAEACIDAFARWDVGSRTKILASIRHDRASTRFNASVVSALRREWSVEASVSPSMHATCSVQLREVASEVPVPWDASAGSIGARPLGVRTQRFIRLSADVRGGSFFRFRTRLERSFASGEPNAGAGVMIAQEVQFLARRSVSLRTRLTIYDISAYEARIFGVEPDLPGAGAISVYDGRGSRWSVVGSVRVFLGIELSLKYAHTVSVPRPDSQSQRRRPEVRTWSGGIQLEDRIEIP